MSRNILSQEKFINYTVKYGIENENITIENCLQIRLSHVYHKSNLLMHESIVYLARSSDGLLDDEGLIEVKCL